MLRPLLLRFAVAFVLIDGENIGVGEAHEVGEIRRDHRSWLQCGDIDTEAGLSHGGRHLIFLAIIVGLLTVARPRKHVPGTPS